ncbi:MAG TPA: tripartite tricarboxylate transporter substrate binding protein [Burkholderiales bacterium]|nr:tripartite tricarboxylate transporter substrate binding protein [Burkholderiales bacterium]
MLQQNTLLAAGARMVLFILGLAAASTTWAQYPDRPITLIVPWPAGGPSDASIRSLASAAEKYLGQPVIVLNKPGANATIGMAQLTQSKPDGYTIGLYNTATYMVPLTGTAVPYDPIKSFSFISYFGDNLAGIVVRNDAKWQTLNELIEDGKKAPDKISFGHPGDLTTETLMVHALEKHSGAQFLAVPYTGAAPALVALLGGHVDFITGPSSWAPYVAKGELRVLAVSSPTRAKSLPNVPTLSELGIPYMRSINALAGPAGIPEPERAKLEAAFRLAAKSERFIDTMDTLRMSPVDMSGAQTKQAIEAERDKAQQFLGK